MGNGITHLSVGTTITQAEYESSNAHVGGTGRGATYVVAASDATATVIAQADSVCDGTADDVQIQAAITALSAGRTWKETVKLIGDFSISQPVVVPDYTILDLTEAKLVLAAGIDDNIIEIASGTSFVDIVGGCIDGNKANQTSDCVGIRCEGSNINILGIYVHDCYADNILVFEPASEVLVSGVYSADAGISGTSLGGCLEVRANVSNIIITDSIFDGGSQGNFVISCHDSETAPSAITLADSVLKNPVTGLPNVLFTVPEGETPTTKFIKINISNCQLSDSTTNAIEVVSSSGVTISTCKFGGTWIDISVDGSTWACSDTQIMGCNCPNGIIIGTNAGGYSVENNPEIDGLLISSGDGQILGNKFTGTHNYGVKANVANLVDILISNNIFRNITPATGDAFGIRAWETGYSRWTISNNTIDTVTTANIAYGVMINGIDILTFSGNQIYAVSQGIRATAITNAMVYGNYFSGTNPFYSSDTPATIAALTQGTGNKAYNNRNLIAPGEVRGIQGALAAGNANAICFAWNNPEIQDILIRKVVVNVTTGGGTASSHLDVGIADDAIGTNRGTEFFDDLLLNTAQVDDSWVGGDGGTQTKWVSCEDSASATDDWVVGQILDANAASLVGKYYIEYIGK